MSFAQYMNLDVRVTGSDSNGGGFDPVSGTPGTNYAEQDSAQIAFTDLVIGATTTQLTSAGNPFTSAHVGNVINVTSGTGFTVQRVQILSVSGSTATCDKSCGTAASTGGHGNLGGGLLTIAAALAMFSLNGTGQIAGWTINIKAGTYTQTSTLAPTYNNSYTIRGYGTTWGDEGTRPLITTATNSTDLFDQYGLNQQAMAVFDNLSFSNTAGTPANGVVITSHDMVGSILFSNCKFSGFTNAFNADNAGAHYTLRGTLFLDACEFTSGASGAVGVYVNSSSNNAGAIVGHWCYFHGLATAGVSFTGYAPNVSFTNSVFYSNGYGIYDNIGANACYKNCAFVSQTNDGIYVNHAISSLLSKYCVFYGNAGYGINNATTSGDLYIKGPAASNAYGSNTSGNYQKYVASPGGDVSLSAAPFTSPSTGDFSLNSTAGGGAALKGAGFPGVAPFGTGYADLAPLQHSAGGGGGGIVANIDLNGGLQ